jgi:hypothetical protein
MFHTVPIVPVVHESQHVQAGIWGHLGHLYAFSTVNGNYFFTGYHKWGAFATWAAG